MLRKQVSYPIHKNLPVPPLCESDNREVLVEVKDPITGEVTSKRTEHISIVRALSAESAVSNEPADLYSIQNMQQVGMQAVMCPTGGYFKPSLDNVPNIENSSVELLDMTEPVESPVVTPVDSPVVSPVEPVKTEE